MRSILLDIGFAWLIAGCVLLGGSGLPMIKDSQTVAIGGTCVVGAGLALILGALLYKRRR